MAKKYNDVFYLKARDKIIAVKRQYPFYVDFHLSWQNRDKIVEWLAERKINFIMGSHDAKVSNLYVLDQYNIDDWKRLFTANVIYPRQSEVYFGFNKVSDAVLFKLTFG
jgi:hypothetical protein